MLKTRAANQLVLIAALLFSGCSNNPDKQLKIYLEEAVLSAQNSHWAETRQLFDKIEGLNYIDVEAAAPFLKQNNERFRCSLVELFGNLGDRKSVEPLVKLLEEEQSLAVKMSIIEALGKLKDMRAAPALEKCIVDKVWGVRFLAANSLGQITGDKYEVKKAEVKTAKKRRKG